MRKLHQRGFSLLEVMIAIGILAMSLTVLLESQASSVNNAGRSRDLTIATLLARSKMIDLEQQLFDEGFTVGETTEEGDFDEEGFEQVKWESTISEVEMDLSSLAGLCDAFSGGGEEPAEGGGESAMDCEGLLGGMGGMEGALGAFTSEIGQSIRLMKLTVTWPVGKYSESLSVRSLITRDDFGIQRVDPGAAGASAAAGAGGAAPKSGGTPGITPSLIPSFGGRK